ncbi:MAG: flagellar motor switch protein FliG [Salinisphaeraceae bacterium]|jgi:flagellar motor switch protein FliG|nr:flagellar motor switch protein FliG [Salinisphaeraceae bacterium]
MPEAAKTADMPDGTARAAIFLLSLGESQAAAVMKHMGAREVQKLGSAMAAIRDVSQTQAESVMQDFVNTMEKQTALGVGAEDYVRKVLYEALGEDKASGLMDRVLMGHNSKGLESLKWMDPRAVAQLIRNEHPQIVAIVLSYLEEDQAAQILMHLPERNRHDIIMRVARLDGIQQSALKELDEIMERQFAGNEGLQSSNVGGMRAAANIVNMLASSDEQSILGQIGKIDETLATSIQDLMFTFDDLASLEDRDLQRVLREIDKAVLGAALKGAESRVAEKIFRNMSERAAEMIREDMEAAGPLKLSEVEDAQKEMLAVARQLADDGEISIASGGDDYV